MGIKRKIFMSLLITAGIAAAGTTGLWQHEKQIHKYLPGTVIEDVDVSGKTVDEVTDMIKQRLSGMGVVIDEDDQNVLYGTLEQFGGVLNETDIKKQLMNISDEQLKDPVTMIKSLIEGTESNFNFDLDIDEEILEKFYDPDNFSVERFNTTQNEIIKTEDGNYEVKEGIKGNQVDIDKLLKQFKDTINALDLKTFLEKNLTLKIPEDAYIDNGPIDNKEELETECKKADTWLGSVITYTFGKKNEILDKETLSEWIEISDNSLELNSEKIAEYVDDLAIRYNTRYHDRKFTTSNGNEITIGGSMNLYGYTIREDAEEEQLTKDIMSGEAVTRDPLYFKANDWGNPYYTGNRNGKDDLNGTYVEVSISDQHLWYYKNGKLKLETDVVTGDVTKNRGTDKGCFPLAYKERNVTLEGGSGSEAWSSPVSYWMPFYNGEGLHDASWRSYFGGSIYKGGGSHGCVNMPYSKAEDLYGMIEPGTAVIVY